MTKTPRLKTKRMLLEPVSLAELESKATSTEDPEERKAYGEMLAGCWEKPEDYLWYAPWKMILRENNAEIGDLCFKGAPQKGTVEIGYGLSSKAHEGMGLMTEAVEAMLDWAFVQDGVYAVEAETAPDNAASQRILQKTRFVPAGEGEEGPRFRREKPQLHWMSIYMCFGLSLGMAIGMSMDQMSLSMCLGMGIGVALGAAMDSSERKKRQAITGEK